MISLWVVRPIFEDILFERPKKQREIALAKSDLHKTHSLFRLIKNNLDWSD